MSEIETYIEQALKESGLTDYAGTYTPLGGGEINDTYLLDLTDGQKVVLRIARYENQTSLKKEAGSLGLLNLRQVPQLLYFDENSRIENRLWVVESYVPGERVERLNLEQFRSLGGLLAQIHSVSEDVEGVNAWQDFLVSCKKFGDAQKLLNHPDPTLRELTDTAKTYFENQQALLEHVKPALVHGDATPSNVLVRGNEVSLIDWEFARFKDPMAEFSTIYYEDMEYNKGKWRVHITSEEKEALFNGYLSAGGVVNEDRIKLWMINDKLSAALFLYWRIHESGRPASSEQLEQYQLDLNTLINSLRRELLT